MRPGLPVGHVHIAHQRVGLELTVPQILPDSCLERGERVLASGFLIAALENACWQALTPVLHRWCVSSYHEGT